MAKFSKGDKVFLSKIIGFYRSFDTDGKTFTFKSFNSDGNAIIDVIASSGKVYTQEVFSNIHQVKFHLGIS